MDAEYYQPRYADLISRLKAYYGGWETMQDAAEFRDGWGVFDADWQSDYLYIDIRRVSDDGEIRRIDDLTPGGEIPPHRGKKVAIPGDVILATVGGQSCFRVAQIPDVGATVILSTAFHAMRPRRYSCGVLMALLRHRSIQAQLYRAESGSTIRSVIQASLERIILPVLSDGVQVEITNALKS